MRHRNVLLPLLAATAAGGLALTGAPAASAGAHNDRGPTVVGPYKHLVVIYEENHSFDNLYGSWGRVGGQQVDGLRTRAAPSTMQVAQDGTPTAACCRTTSTSPRRPAADHVHGHRRTACPRATSATRRSRIDDYIQPTDTTCPPPGVFAPNGVLKGSGPAGGCTRDLVHRFYQEQYQLDGGRQDRYVTGSDAVGLTMGHYDTKQLPIYRYLHSQGAPNYVIADHFFQAAFGGSFLNHQYLVAARAPIDTDPRRDAGPADLHSVVDTNGLPERDATRCTSRPTAGQRRPAHPGLRPADDEPAAWPAATTRSTRCSRRSAAARAAAPCCR